MYSVMCSWFYATHPINMADCMRKELLSMGATVIEEETSTSKTMFCYSGSDPEIINSMNRLKQSRCADKIFLKIYHNWMRPKTIHPHDLSEIRDYQEHIVYGINYVEELSRIGRLIAILNGREENFNENCLKINLKLETSEKGYIWYRALQILKQCLPNHLLYEAKKRNWFWSVSVERQSTNGDCIATTSKEHDVLSVSITADRHSIYGGVLLYDHNIFRPHLTFWQLNGAIAATVVELAGIRDGDIILDMTCEYGDLILEVLQNYDCFYIGMSHKIDELAMAEVNWSGLQNWHRHQAGNRARHLQFIAAEFNKNFFNFNVVNKIMCTLPLRMSNAIPAVLDAFYDKLFTIISKCRQETHSVLLIPLLKWHILRVIEASLSSKYNFQVLVMKHAMTSNTQMYICLLETKLPLQAVEAVNLEDISCSTLLLKTVSNTSLERKNQIS